MGMEMSSFSKWGGGLKWEGITPFINYEFKITYKFGDHVQILKTFQKLFGIEETEGTSP